MYFYMLLAISLIPLALFIFLYVNERSRMVHPLRTFLLLLFIWNLDVVVLFSRGILTEEAVLLLFKIFRFGSIMYLPFVYYLALTIFERLGPKYRKWRVVLNRPIYVLLLLFSLTVYIVNFTPLGIQEIQYVEGSEFFPGHFYPVYGELNSLYMINVLLVFASTGLLFLMVRRLEKNPYRSFGIYIVVSILFVFINGALSGFNVYPLPISLFNAVFVTMVIFSAYFYTNNQMIKEMNSELVDQKNFLQTVIDLNPNFLYVKDMDGQFVIVNRAYEKAFGNELRLSTLFEGHPSQYDFQQEEIKQYEKSVTDDHGISRKLEIKEIPMMTTKGHQLMLYVANDITQRLKEEEYIRQTEKLGVVGELAAGVAHEIRNPLTSLKGFIQLMKDDSQYEKRHFYLDIMSSEIDRISEVINELLLLAKPQADVFEKMDVVKILQDVKMLMDTSAIMRNIKIDIEQTGDIPKIDGMENQIKQVFINIVKNAVEALPNGGNIRIAIQKKDGDKIDVSVKDDGVGISSDRLKKMGEPFYTTKEKGTGLGLTVCYRIVKRHHGEIEFESELGKGTTVLITLPITHD